jgi:hypothetical protein
MNINMGKLGGYMKSATNSRILILVCFAMAVIPALTLSAQIAPTLIGVTVDSDGPLYGLPASRPAYNPQSGVSKATMGTIIANADRAMSVLDFGSVQATSYFGYLGVDESIIDGLNVGFGTKVGKKKGGWFGVAYGGSLINELAMRLTNQDVIGMKLVNAITEVPDPSNLGTYITTSSPYLVNGADEKLTEGVHTSDNTLSFLWGTGVFGVKIGFSEFIQGTYRNAFHQLIKKPGDTDSLNTYLEDAAIIESSLKPFLELGFNVGGERFRFKPAIRAAWDLHQYNSTTKTVTNDESTATSWTTDKTELYDFNELSSGVTLGFDFNHSAHTQAELDIIADVAIRKNIELGDWLVSGYANDAIKDLVISNWTINGTETEYKTSEISDWRIPLSAAFTWRKDLTERFTLGWTGKVGGGYNILKLTQYEEKDPNPASPKPQFKYENEITTYSITPDFSVGASFNLLPEHIAVHGGLGIELFSLENTVTTTTKTDLADGAGDPEENAQTVRTIGVPAARLAVGLTVNFTRNTALDLLAVAANVAQLDSTKFTMLFTIKK